MTKKINGLIYLATNTENGKQYVGLTVRPLERRIHGHISAAMRGRGSKYTLQAAIREFGAQKIKFEKIASAETIEELARKEITYIEKYNTLWPKGYNQNRGGAAGSGGDLYFIEGEEFFGLSKVADAYGILEITMQKRMKSGRWTIEQACGIEPPPKFEKEGISIDLDGDEFISLNAAAKHFGVDKRIVDMRLNRMGWSLEEAFGLKERNLNAFEVMGVKYDSFKAACEKFGLHIKKVESRMRLGWSVAEAFEFKKRPYDPIIVDGITFKKLSEASAYFGIPHRKAYGRIRAGWTYEQAYELQAPPKKKAPTRPQSIILEGVEYRNRTEACRKYGVNESMVRARLKKGVSLEEAFNLKKGAVKDVRKSIVVEGKHYATLSAAAKAYGVNPSTVTYRIRKDWSPEQALGVAPPPQNNDKHIKVEVAGKVFSSVHEVCRYYGVDVSNYRYRVKKGWSISQALGLASPPSKAKKKYIVTTPTGKEIFVDDYPKFAREQGFPQDGNTLRKTANAPKNHTWRGWRIREVEVVSDLPCK